MQPNPYTPPSPPASESGQLLDLVASTVAAIAILLLAIASVLGILSDFVTDALDEWYKPRFGSMGTSPTIMPVFMLWQWFRTPKSSTLAYPGCALLFMAAVNAFWVSDTGTTAVIENYAQDRLHSYWFWNVGSHVILGLALLVVGVLQKSRQEAAPMDLDSVAEEEPH